MKRKLQKGNYLIVAAIAVLLLIAGIFVSATNFPTGEEAKDNSSLVGDLVKRTSPSPTPFAFQELTIPHLRSRDFKSSLGELEQLNKSPDYTSYLTSYDSDGLSINGLLTIPEGEMPEGGWSAIVFVHGYIPPSTYQTTDNYSSYVDHLARNGFVVFKIDLRGHADSEGEPGGAYYSSDYIIDTLNAHAALQESDFVNPEAIGLWGHSMAGNVIFRSFVASDEVPAIVIWSGAVYTYEDFEEYGISDVSYRPPDENSERRRYRQELMDTYGDFDPESDFWKKVVPTNYLDGIKGAVQLNHAVNDPVVDMRYSRNLMNILDGTDITHELNEYLAGGHNITSPAFSMAMDNTTSFFRENLAQ